MERKDLEKEEEEEVKVKVGGGYIDNKRCNEYIIISISKMKDGDRGEWIGGVIYKVNGVEGLWCRSVESFKSDFSDGKVEGNEVYV